MSTTCSCSVCGAANEQAPTQCFACGHLLVQYLEGITLETDLEMRAAQGRALQLDETLNLTLQLCAVLNYLHTQEPPVIFRDLKPGNIIRTSEGDVCLIDFGIARFFRPGQAHDTQPLGSPGYAAPEQYGRAQTTPQSDIYSLGVLLHTLLTGHDPADRELAPLHLEQEISGIDLAVLVQRVVAPSPSERPASIREVATTLEATHRQRQSQSTARIWHPPTPQTPPSPSPPTSDRPQIPMQLPPHPGGPATPSVVHRTTRRKVVIGLGTLTAATVGGSIWWVSGTTLRSSSSSVHPQSSPSTYSGPVSIYRRHTAGITAVTWSPDSKRIASSSYDHTVQVWEAGNGGQRFTYHVPTAPVTDVAWSPDGSRIASCSNHDEIVQVWEATTGKQLLTYHQQKSSMYPIITVTAVAWSPDGQYIVSVDNNGTVQIWEVISGKQLLIYHADRYVAAVAWSPDGHSIAMGTLAHVVQVWEAPTGKNVLRYSGHTDAVVTMAWSPDGKQIASGSADATVRVWNAPKSTEQTGR